MTVERALMVQPPAAAPASSDPNWPNVSLLLHGDGTNGAQNNTFVDSSSNAFSITRNGNTTSGSYTPFGSLWSNYFDGSSYLANTSSALITQTVSTFTVEGWIYMTAAPTTDANNISGFVALDGQPATTTNYMSFGPVSGRNLYLRWWTGSANTAIGSTTLNLNQWYHIACVVNSNSIQFYVNGVAETMSGTTTLTNRSGTSGNFSVGKNYWGAVSGYISNLRVTTTAVYTSNFTPSTAPLTAITNTSLLTCQSNRFIDNSSNNFALTRSGTPQISPYSPFSTGVAYDPATNGGSGYFDGSGDYLSAASNAVFAFGTGDFTIESWVNIVSYSGTCGIFDTRTAGNEATGVIFYVTATGAISIYNNGTLATSSGTITANTWNHVVVTRSGTTVTFWINGSSSGTATVSTNFSQQNSFVGAAYNGSSNPFYGYISNLRIVKGTAVYTSNFTPPTAPLTAITNTSLLLLTANAGIYDNAVQNDLETVGNAQISTTVKKYGTGSLAFDGAGDYLIPSTANLGAFGTGDFTIECWVYFNSVGTNQVLLDFRAASADVAPALYLGSSAINWYVTGANRITTSTLTATTWYHVAVTRASGSTKVFINGTQGGSTYADTNSYVGKSARPWIGALADGTGPPIDLNGYIDDLRITKGIARYTANFTPPTAAFPNY